MHETTIRLPYQGAFAAEDYLQWYAGRLIDDVERVEPDGRYARTLSLRGGPALLRLEIDEAAQEVVADLTLSSLTDADEATALVARVTDLDADPARSDAAVATHPALAPLVADAPGIRLPGCPTLQEALMRAITGQQVTVESGRQQLVRLCAHGETIHVDGQDWRLLPSPAVTAATAEDWYRGPARQRRTVEAAMAALPDLEPLAATEDAPGLHAALLTLPGVGPWTADYVCLRTVRATDLMPVGDVAIVGAARRLGIADDAKGLAAAMAPLSPWRSHAALHLWRAAGLQTRARRGGMET